MHEFGQCRFSWNFPSKFFPIRFGRWKGACTANQDKQIPKFVWNSKYGSFTSIKRTRHRFYLWSRRWINHSILHQRGFRLPNIWSYYTTSNDTSGTRMGQWVQYYPLLHFFFLYRFNKLPEHFQFHEFFFLFQLSFIIAAGCDRRILIYDSQVKFNVWKKCVKKPLLK